jgi:predicted nucleic-acid-binding protein
LRITADTNILLRAALNDHPSQSPAAQAVLEDAERVVVTLAALCEFVWVTRNGLKLPADAIAGALQSLLSGGNVEANRSAAAAGLAQMLAGGDFADGAMAKEGTELGGDIFVTFDRNAAALVEKSGGRTELLK